jgi:apolipoprotein N-acyltransferase
MNKFMENKWALSITAGILLGLSFPPIDLSFLSFPAFILFFLLSDKCDSNKQLAYYGYAGFVTWNLITTYWLMMASLVAGVAAILANAAIMTIPLVLFRVFSKKFSRKWIIALLQASIWVSYEFLHHNWDLSWPWLTIGNAWSNQITLIQYISATGHLAISFWVVLTSAFAYLAFKEKSRSIAIAATMSLLMPSGISLLMFVNSTEPPATNTTFVTVIQPNHDSYFTNGGMSSHNELVDSLFSITNKIKTNETELVVWPENALDAALYMNSRSVLMLSDSAKKWNTSIIAGTGLFKLYDTPPVLYRDTYRGEPRNYFNSAIYVDSKGELSRYDKNNLVPIVERFPFVEFFNAFDVFGWLNWGKIAGFGKGTSPTSLKDESFTTHGLVCYDSVYPSWIREFVKDEADFITIITNDGWWGNTSGHHQHFAYARLRAIEFDRWVVRSANNGISGIIDPEGKIFEKTDYWERTGFNFDVPSKQTKTIYTRFGDWFGYLCLLLSGIGLGFITFTQFQHNRSDSNN